MQDANLKTRCFERYKIFDDFLEEVTVLSPDFKLLYANNSARENNERLKNASINLSLLDTIPGFENSDVHKKLLDCFTGKTPKHYTGLLTTPYKTKHVDLRYTPVPEGILVFVIDITQRIINREALEKLNKKLDQKVKKKTQKLADSLKREQRLNELKSAFVSIASHEFRTPLATMLTSISLMEHYNGTREQEKRKKYFNGITSSVEALHSILEDFLCFDELESGKINYYRESVELTTYFREITDNLQLLCAEGQVITYKHDGDRYFSLDRQIIKNVMNNLVSNAIKYSPNGEDVVLNTQTDNDCLIITVKDHGIGIPNGEQELLFEKFFRASNTKTLEGTGLGLYIIKGYLDLAGGHLTFKSDLGQGSAFTVTLPKEKSIP